MDIIVAMSDSKDFKQGIFKNTYDKNYIFKYTKKGFYEELNSIKLKIRNPILIIFKKLNDQEEFNFYELKELKTINKNSKILIILENDEEKNIDFLIQLTSLYLDNIIFYKDLKNFNLDKIFELSHLELLKKFNLQENLIDNLKLKEIYRQILTLENQRTLENYTKILLSQYDTKTLKYIIKKAPKKIKNILKKDKNIVLLYPKENIFTLLSEKIFNYKKFIYADNKNTIYQINEQKIYLSFSNNNCGSTEIASNFSNALEKIHNNKKIALVDFDFYENSCSYNFVNNNKNYKRFIDLNFSEANFHNHNFINYKNTYYFKSKNLYFYTNVSKNQNNINVQDAIGKQSLTDENLDNLKNFINLLLIDFDYIIIDFNLNLEIKLIKYLFDLNTIKLLILDENLKNLFSLKKYLIENTDLFRYAKLNIIINKYEKYLNLNDLKNFFLTESNINISSFIKIPYESKIHKYKFENKTVYDFSSENFKESIKNIYYKSF